MANIRERKDSTGKVTYTVQIRIKGHPPEVATFERKTDAKLWAQQTEAAIREGRYFKTLESKKRTLADLIERFVSTELPRRRADAPKVTVHLNWWKQKLGAYVLSDINHVRISELKEALRNEPTKRGEYRSNATINRFLASLSICFAYGVRDLGWLNENPCLHVRRPQEPSGRVRFLSDAERARLIKEALTDVSASRIYPFIVIALSTGMRSSEITRLQWPEVDLRNRRVILNKTKNGERRSVPLAKQAYEMLRDMGKVRKIDSDYVLTQKDGKTPYNPRKAWLRIIEKAKINDIRIHDLRHSAASYLAMEGATLLELAEILGHKTLAMVKRYAHLTEGHTAKIMEKMNQRRQFQ